MFRAFCFLVIYLSFNSAQEWTYERQNHWSQLFRTCGGSRQSPININTNDVRSNPLLKLNLIGYNWPQRDMIANNNGHTVRIILNSKSKRPQISGSAVHTESVPFVFEEFHFHWGDDNFEGTEHSIDRLFGSAELHFVHYNQRYGSLVKARERNDGIVVVTVLLRESRNDNKALEPIIKILSKINEFNTSAVIPNTFTFEKILPFNRDLFFRYKGSLTTPPCSEGVTFIIYSEPIKISPFQLSQFRRLFERQIRGRNRHIISNTRELHHKNGRLVEVSVPRPEVSFIENDIEN